MRLRPRRSAAAARTPSGHVCSVSPVEADGADTTGDSQPSTHDGEIGRMARGGGLNVVGAAISQGSLFVTMAVLAVATSSADVGRYSMCYALLSILTLVSLGGLRATLTRFVAMRLADADAGAARGTIRLGMTISAGLGLLVSAALALLAEQVATLLHEPGLRDGILLIATAVLASTIEGASLAATQGWRSQRAFTLIGSILVPGLRLVLTVLTLWQGLGLMGALWAVAISSWTGAVLAIVVLVRRLRRVERARPTYDPRPMVSFAVVSWGSTLATTGIVWADTLILGYLTSAEEVGVYTVATRLVTLAIFVLNPINSAFVPHVAHLYHRGDRHGVDAVYGAANRWILRLSAPAFILLLAFPEDLLDLFGSGYGTASAVTVVLAVGQLANTAAGPCGSVLNMCGLVRVSLLDNVAALTVNVGLNLLLIPPYGVLGAAVAWTTSLVLVNATKYVQVRRMLGIRARGAGTGRTLAAALPGAVVAAGLSLALDGPTATLLVAAPTVLAVYVTVLLLRGLEPDDRAFIAHVLRRGVPSPSPAPGMGPGGASLP